MEHLSKVNLRHHLYHEEGWAGEEGLSVLPLSHPFINFIMVVNWSSQQQQQQQQQPQG